MRDFVAEDGKRIVLPKDIVDHPDGKIMMVDVFPAVDIYQDVENARFRHSTTHRTTRWGVGARSHTGTDDTVFAYVKRYAAKYNRSLDSISWEDLRGINMFCLVTHHRDGRVEYPRSTVILFLYRLARLVLYESLAEVPTEVTIAIANFRLGDPKGRKYLTLDPMYDQGESEPI